MSHYLPMISLCISIFDFGVSAFSFAAYRRKTRQAVDVLRTVTHSARGIYKRLDELEELDLFVSEAIPELAQEKPWVFGWIEGQRIWMTDLIEQLEKSDPGFRRFSELQKSRYTCNGSGV
ncbi:hypothetical protein ACYCFK_09520 [Stutzerimonas stutzeri]